MMLIVVSFDSLSKTCFGEAFPTHGFAFFGFIVVLFAEWAEFQPFAGSKMATSTQWYAVFEAKVFFPADTASFLRMMWDFSLHWRAMPGTEFIFEKCVTVCFPFLTPPRRVTLLHMRTRLNVFTGLLLDICRCSARASL